LYAGTYSPLGTHNDYGFVRNLVDSHAVRAQALNVCWPEPGGSGEKQRPAAVSCLPLLDWWEIEGNLHAVKIGSATEIDNPANSVLLSGIICNTEELGIQRARDCLCSQLSVRPAVFVT
jgi:hypothetical protein